MPVASILVLTVLLVLRLELRDLPHALLVLQESMPLLPSLPPVWTALLDVPLVDTLLRFAKSVVWEPMLPPTDLTIARLVPLDISRMLKVRMSASHVRSVRLLVPLAKLCALNAMLDSTRTKLLQATATRVQLEHLSLMRARAPASAALLDLPLESRVRLSVLSVTLVSTPTRLAPQLVLHVASANTLKRTLLAEVLLLVRTVPLVAISLPRDSLSVFLVLLVLTPAPRACRLASTALPDSTPTSLQPLPVLTVMKELSLSEERFSVTHVLPVRL